MLLAICDCSYLPNAQAVQEARGGILLRVALRRSFAALRLDAGNANLDDESRRMIRSAAFHHEVIGLHSFFQGAGLGPFLQRGFRVAEFRRERGEGVVPITRNETPRGFDAAVQI